MSKAWWLMPLVLTLRKQRKTELCDFKANQGYIVRPLSQKKKDLKIIIKMAHYCSQAMRMG